MKGEGVGVDADANIEFSSEAKISFSASEIVCKILCQLSPLLKLGHKYTWA